MQTVEQRIARLDKRIAMFESYLKTQVTGLNIKYKKCTPIEKLSLMTSLAQNIFQFKIIATQPLPCFPKGGSMSECTSE